MAAPVRALSRALRRAPTLARGLAWICLPTSILLTLGAAGILAPALWGLTQPLPVRLLALLTLLPVPLLCVLSLGVLARSWVLEQCAEADELSEDEAFDHSPEHALECAGWKVATLVTHGGRWWFAGAFHGSYETSAVARCGAEPTHLPPVPGCGCGLHAFWDRDAARRYAHEVRGSGGEDSLALVRVEAYGEVLTYEHGFRAESHDVTEVHLSARCRCGEASTHLRLVPGRAVDVAEVACAACAGPLAPTTADLTRALGVPVHLAPGW